MAFNINAQIILSGPKNLDKIASNIQSKLKQAGNISINLPAADLSQFTKSINQLNSAASKLNSNSQQIASSLSKLNTLNTATASSTNQLANAQVNVAKASAKAAGGLDAFGRQAAASLKSAFAFAVTTRAVFGLSNAIKSSVKDAIEFERSLINIAQTTGASLGQLQTLKNTVNELSVDLGLNANELIEVARTLAQTGQTAKQVEQSLTALAKSSLAASFGDIKETTEGLVAALAQFNISTSQSEQILGSLNSVSKAFAVEAEDLITAIRKAGGVFSVAATDAKEPIEALQQLSAIFTAVRATTRESAETIGTGLRTIFTRIQRAGTIEFLKKFNIELVNSEGQFVGLFEAFRRLSAGLDDIIKRGDALQLSAIVEELGGVRQVGKLIPAIREFQKAEQAFKVAQQGAAEGLTKDVDVALGGLAKRFEQTQAKFQELIRGIAESATFQNLARLALTTADAFIALADKLKPLLPLIATLGASFIAKGAAQFAGGFFSAIGGGGLGRIGTTLGGGTGQSSSAPSQTIVDVDVPDPIPLITNTNAILNIISTQLNDINTVVTTNSTRNIAQMAYLNDTAYKGFNNVVSAISNLKISSAPTGVSNKIVGFAAGDIGKASGGKIHKFARGGVVPGQGNQDTVPAMLTPGEFVIKKSSVGKIGVDTLAAMNENRKMAGSSGTGERKPYKTKKTEKEMFKDFLKDPQYTTDNQRYAAIQKEFRLSDQEREMIRNDQFPSAAFERIRKDKGGTFATEKDIAILKDSIVGGLFLEEGKAKDAKIDKALPNITEGLLKNKKQLKTSLYLGMIDSAVKDIMVQELQTQFASAITNSVKKTLKSDADPSLSQTVLDRIDFNSIQGYMLEGFISARSGALLSEKGANIDFVGMTSDQKQSLNTVFTPDIPEQTKLIDAKRTADYGSISSGSGSLFNKIISASMSGQLNKDDFLQLAKGGVIGNTLKGQASRSTFINRDKKTIGFKKDKFYISDAYSEKVKVPKSLAIQYGISAERKSIKGSKGKGFEEYLNALGKYGSWQTQANYPVDFIKGSTLYDAKDMLESRFNEKNAIKKALNHYVYKAFGNKGYNFSGPVPPTIELPSNAKLLNTSVTSGQDTFTSNAKIGFLYPEIVEDNEFEGGKKKITSIKKKTTSKPISDNTADTFYKNWNGRSKGSNGVGETDTVPALLTPGEFVVNKEAAKSIGYGNLNRMNKQGVVGFNKGGIVGVQRFENGGMAADALFTNLAKVDLSKIVDLSKLENVAYGVLDNLESRLKELQKGVVGESKKNRESRASQNAAEIAQLEEQRLNTIKLINTVEEKRSKTTQKVKPSAPAQQAVDKTTLAQSQSRILKGVFNPKDTESFQAALQKAGVSAENSAAVIKQFNDLINMGASEMDSFIAVLKDVGLKPIQKASATGISESGGFKGTTLFEPPAQPAAKVAVEKSSEQTVAKTTSQSQDKSAKITFNPKDSEGFKVALQKAGVSAEKSASLVETFNFRIEQGIPQLEALKEVLSSVKLQATKKEQPASAGMSESGGFRGASIFEPPSGPPSEPPEPPEENTQATDQTSEEIKKLGEQTNNVTTQLSEEAKLLAKQSISRSLETLTGAVASTITAFATFDSSNPLASLAALGTSAIQAKNALLQVKEARDLIKASQPTPAGEEAAGPDGLSQILDSFTGVVGDFETSFADSFNPSKLADAFDPDQLKAAVTSKEGFVKSLNLGKGGFSIGNLAGKAAAGGAAAAAVSAAVGPVVDGLTNALFGATESIEGFAGREGWTKGQAQVLGGLSEGLKGAASGAAAGAVLGPVGAAVGALIGVIGGTAIGAIEAGLQQEAYNALKSLKTSTEDASKSLEDFNKKTNIGADDIRSVTSELRTLNKDAGTALKATYTASLGAVGSAMVGSEMGGAGPGVGAASKAVFGRSFIDSSDFTDVMTDIGVSLSSPVLALTTLGNTLKDVGAAAGEMLGVGEEVGSLFVQFATLGLVNLGDLFTSLTDQVLGFAGMDSATIAATATAESFAAVMKSIGPEAIQQANDALAKSAQQFVKDLDTLNATEFVDQLAGLSLGDGIFDTTAGAFKQLGDTLTAAANAGNKAAQALKSQMEQTFQLNVLDSVSKQIELLNASGDKQGVLDLSKAFQFLQSSGRPASEWTEVLASNLNELGLASSFGADPLFKIIQAEKAKQVELLKSAAVQAQTNRLLKESRAYIDALGEGLKKFGDVASQASDRFDMFAANLSQSIEQAFSSTAGGFQVQRFNPFENIDIASDIDLSRAFEEFRTYASPETGDIAFSGLEDLAKVTKEIPFKMKEVALGMVSGGENENVDPQAFLQTITEQLSGAGLELPDVAYEAIRKQLEAMANASDDGTIAITDFIDALEEGDIGSLLGGLGPQMLEEASKVRAAGDRMTNTLLKISDMQLDLARKDRMHRLDMFKMAEDTESRIAKIRGTGMVDETTRAERSVSGQMMAVAGTTDTGALLAQRQAAITERNRLQTQLNTGRIATGEVDASGQAITRAADPAEQEAATTQLAAMNEQFESSTQALEIFARETERLAAIEAQAAAAKERESRVVGGSIELFKKLQNEARTGKRDTSIDEGLRSTAALGKVVEGGTIGQDEALTLLEDLRSGNNAMLEASFAQAQAADPTLDRAQLEEKLFKDVATQVAALPNAVERFGTADASVIQKVLVAEFEAAKSESEKLADAATKIFNEQKDVLQQIYDQNRQQAVEALAQADQAFLATVLEFGAAVEQFAALRSEEVQVAEGKRKIDQQAAEEKKADEEALAAEKEAIASGSGVQTAETRKMALDTMVSEREKTVQAKAARLQAFETEKARRNTYIDKGNAAFNSDELREYESLKREVSTGQSELQDFKRAQEEAGLMVQQENLKREIDSGQLSEADKRKKEEELAKVQEQLQAGRAAGTYGRYEAGREAMIDEADKRVAQENKDNEIAKVEARYQEREAQRQERVKADYATVEQQAAEERAQREKEIQEGKEKRSRMAQEASGVVGPTAAPAAGAAAPAAGAAAPAAGAAPESLNTTLQPAVGETSRQPAESIPYVAETSAAVMATGPAAPAAGAAPAMGEEERKVREAQAADDAWLQGVQNSESYQNMIAHGQESNRAEDARIAALPPEERAKAEQEREERRKKSQEYTRNYNEERRAKREQEIAEARARDQANAAAATVPPAPGAQPGAPDPIREATAAGAYNQSMAQSSNAGERNIAGAFAVATPPTTPGTAQMQQQVAGQTAPTAPTTAPGVATGQVQRPATPYEARLQSEIARGQQNLQNLGGFSARDKEQLAALEAKKKEGNLGEGEKRQLADLKRRSNISGAVESRQTALKSFQSEQTDFGKNLKNSFKEGGEMMVQSLQTFIEGFQSVTSMIPEMIQTNVGGEVTVNLLGTKGLEDAIIQRMQEYLMAEIVPMLKPNTTTREGDMG